MAMGKYGKDRPAESAEGYIGRALRDGSGPSNGIHNYDVDRPNQSIKTAVALDNVKLAMPIESSILDTDARGGVTNLKHSLTGTSSVNEEVGASGSVKHTIIPDH